MTYNYTSLGKFISVQGGYAFKSKEFKESGAFPVIKIKNVRFGTVDYSDTAYVDENTANGLERFLTKNGDILISMTGSGFNAPQSLVGRVARVSDGDPEVLINQRVGRIIFSKEHRIHPDFVFYLLSLPDTIHYLVANSTGSANQANINSATICSVPCPDISYDESKRIANILRSLDDKIASNTYMNQTLEKIAQRIFKSWFIDFDPVKANAEGVPFNGLSPEIQGLFPSEFEDSAFGMIPKGWQFLPFKNVIDKYVDNRGKTPPIVDEGIPLVEVKHLLENSAFPNLNVEKRVTIETFNNWFRTHVEHKDVLISTVGTIGRTSYVKNTDFCIAQNVLGLRFGKIAEPAYMFYTIKAKRFQDDMNARLVTTVQPSIKRKDLDTISILIPPPSIQQTFCSVIESLLDAQYSRNNENILLTRIRDKLLPKLLSGQILLSDANQELKEAV